MKITPWKSKETWLDPFEELHKEMNDLFKRRMGSSSFDDSWMPAVDIINEKGSMTVTADIPGWTKDQIEVTANEGILTIKGNKKEEKEVKEKDFIRSERYSGSFERSFSLPATVDESKIKAKYKDGVLTVTLPKKEGANSEIPRIEID